ncbi:hypothetical protein J6590_102757 [Homalodisca vitripennis]|nr:hypothetical protein J6590_102757 [Homalodisca vitripennis]
MAYHYCHSNDLLVNSEKTNQLAFGRRCEEVPAFLEVNRIPRYAGLSEEIKASCSGRSKAAWECAKPSS